MPDEKDIEQLLSILRDEHQPEDARRQALQQLLALNEDVKALLQQDFTPVAPLTAAASNEVDEAYNRLRQNWPQQQPLSLSTAPARLIRFRRWGTVAAAVLAGIVAIWLFKQQTGRTIPQPDTASSTQASLSDILPPVYDTIRNTGSAASFHRLQDQSTVLLEPNSYICFRDSFDTHRKEIFLHGSALFAVHKEADRPFSVYANGIEVLDLGTVFSVTTQHSLVKVKLIQGKVVVRPASTRMHMEDIGLKPGQEFRIDTTTLQYAVHTTTPDKRIQDSKLSRDLAFNNTSLQEVFRQLEKECNITIHYNINEVKEKAFTGNLDAGSNTKNIIAMICMVNDLTYEIKNNRFYIHH